MKTKQPKKKRIPLIPLVLIVYTKFSKVENYKSTHRFNCIKTDVPKILSNLEDKGYIINKVYFNNKTYKR